MRDVYERNAIIGGVCGGVALIAIVAVAAVRFFLLLPRAAFFVTMSVSKNIGGFYGSR